MRISVVIPTRDRPMMLAQCLQCLAPNRQLGIYPDIFEVVVTDDAPDCTARASLAGEFPWARWTAGPRRGPAANRNHGAQVARGEWLVFVDDDCLPGERFLAAYADAVDEYPQLSVFEGATRPERPRVRMDEEAPINETGGFLWSCNFAIRRELFFRLGGFWEGFSHAAMEDVDLRERLRAAGEKMVFVPSAAVVHPWRRMVGGAWRFAVVRLTAHDIYFRRHPALFPGAGEYLRVVTIIWLIQFWRDGWRCRFIGVYRWVIRHVGLSLLFIGLACRRKSFPQPPRGNGGIR